MWVVQFDPMNDQNMKILIKECLYGLVPNYERGMVIGGD